MSDGKLDALVTAPLSKPNVKTDRFNFTGHTEYLENQFKCEGVLMLMVNELMRIGVVTSHIPPLLARFGVTSTCRASFGLYNTREEIDALVAALRKAETLFG